MVETNFIGDSMSIPKFQELRSRVQTRMAEARTRVRGQGLAGQQMRLGKGVLVEQVRQRADMVARRMAERKPGVIPMVKEFRPGERLREFLPEVTDRKDMAVEGRPAYPFDGRDMAVFVE